jgi:hypothetical protein
MGAFDAFGMPAGIFPMAQQTSASPTPTRTPTPTPSETCDIPIPVPPVCEEDSSSPSASPTPSASPSASAEEHDSTISINYARTAFTGAVNSAAKCEPKRKVIVRKVRKGPDTLIGKDTTDNKGKWSVAFEDPHGKYYAKVLKRVFTQLDTEVTCNGAKSKVLRVG